MWQQIFQLIQIVLQQFMGKKTQEEQPKLEPKVQNLIVNPPVLTQAPKPSMTWKASPNYSVKPNREISAIILHHTATFNGKIDLEWLCNHEAKVSAHYLIDMDGTIYNLVEEKNVAWHAGVSELHGRQYVNNFSLGIEVVGDTNKKEFTAEQYKSIVELVKYLLQKYNVKPESIVSHREISPGRKTDLNSDHWDWLTFYKAIEVID